MEDFIKTLKTKFIFHLWYKSYADDLVVKIHQDHLYYFIKIFFQTAKDYNFEINSEKSNIMAIKNLQPILNHKLTHNIKCCSQYKYLGIHIDNHGRIPFKN